VATIGRTRESQSGVGVGEWRKSIAKAGLAAFVEIKPTAFVLLSLSISIPADVFSHSNSVKPPMSGCRSLRRKPASRGNDLMAAPNSAFAILSSYNLLEIEPKLLAGAEKMRET